MPEGDSFTHAQTRPLWTDWPQYLHVVWSPRRNQLYNFFENRPKGFGVGRPRNMAFPIDFAGHPYNTHYRVSVW